jgi:hypothetical protein
MPTPGFPFNRGVHFLDRSRRPSVLQHAAEIADRELLLLFDALKQNAFGMLFDRKLRAWLPMALVAKLLRQDNLTSGRDNCLRHGLILPVRWEVRQLPAWDHAHDASVLNCCGERAFLSKVAPFAK